MKKSLLYVLCFSFLFFSCTTNAVMNIEDNGQSSFVFETSASDGVGSIIRSFSGVGSTVNVFDKNIIEESFSAAKIQLDFIDTSGTASISLSGFTEDINTLVPFGDQPLVLRSTEKGKELTVILNERTMASLFSLMGEEALLYIELLQAPLFTGEQMTSDEYLDFIGALYGPEMKDDLRNSSLSFVLNVPNTVRSASLEPQNIGEVILDGEAILVKVSLPEFLSNSSQVELIASWDN